MSIIREEGKGRALPGKIILNNLGTSVAPRTTSDYSNRFLH